MTPWARIRAACVVVVSNNSFRSGDGGVTPIFGAARCRPIVAMIACVQLLLTIRHDGTRPSAC
jgi:hypothetical protein